MPSLNRRRWRFHGLKKPKVRQDWNKYNLYNISRLSAPNTATRTYFQQKWTAKASTRAYHGEVIREQQWERMFSRTAHAVVPMDPAYLAEHDGAEHAAGRGSGLELAPGVRPPRPPLATPYMQMAYHPTERRLDTAIFRALFASSVRQARQFVVHGQVRVNGKKMIHPGYLLNPGDMFQVDPERVLFATGAWKGSPIEFRYFETLPPSEVADARAAAQGRKIKDDADLLELEKFNSLAEEEEEGDENDEANSTSSLEEDLAALDLDDDASDASASDQSPDDPSSTTKKQLLSLRQRAKALLTDPPRGTRVTASRKQELRAFGKSLKSHLSRAAAVTPSALDDLEMQLQGIAERVVASSAASSRARGIAAAAKSPSPASSAPPPSRSSQPPAPTTTTLDPAKTILPPPSPTHPTFDASKPYATPWRPRDYMPAFAFLPRYLEVNQHVCAAVYLRHPVCRPGLAEVPTPFHPETMQLAFNYYLRRR